MALAVTLDKAVYDVGDKMTLTVVTAEGDRAVYTTVPFSVHVVVGNLSGDVDGAVRKREADLVPVVVTDSSSREWVDGPDDGLAAVFTAVA